MLRESNLILASVDFLEKTITKKLNDIDKAELENNFPEMENLKEQILSLINKLNKEKVNMDNYMLKYTGVLRNEKKELLHSLGKKKQISIRSVPKNKSWT